MNRNWPTFTVEQLQQAGCLLVEDGNHGEDRPRPHEFGSGQTAFIRAADMSEGRVLFESAEHINDAALHRIRKGIGRGGDILFSHKGTVGKLALVPLDAPPFVCSPQTTFWRTNDESRLDRRFLYYYMASRAFVEQWHSRKGETDMADYVSLTAQRGFSVAVPSINEQHAIARVLGALDDKIQLNNRIKRTLEAVVRALFKWCFIDFGPVGSTAEGRRPLRVVVQVAAQFANAFQESELGPIPEGWSVATVADLARYVNGRNFTRGAIGAGRMVIRIAELNSGQGASTVYSDAPSAPENTAYPGDLLFSWSGSLGVYRWVRDEALINQHIFKVVCERYPQWFVHGHLLEALPFFQGIAADKATTMGHIKREHLRSVTIALPPAQFLGTMSETVAPLYQKLLQSERESLTLASIRNMLLPSLMSGEVRVGQGEKLVEQAV